MTTIVKPAGPETLASVDRRLRAIAYDLQLQSVAVVVDPAAAALYREQALMDCDRLLDVRLAITKAKP